MDVLKEFGAENKVVCSTTDNASNEKKAMTDASKTQNDDVWFDDVDPVLLDVAEKGLMGGSDAEDALVKAKSFTGLTKVCILSVTDIQNNCLSSRCLEWTVRW